MPEKTTLHVAGLLVGSIVLSGIARFAAQGEVIKTIGTTEVQQEQEFIRWLAMAAFIFISALSVSRWKGISAAYLAMIFIVACMILLSRP